MMSTEPAVVNSIEEVFVKRATGGGGQWTCQHCQMVPFRFRAPGCIFYDDNDEPPDQAYVEKHLSVCCGNTYYMAGAGVSQGATVGSSSTSTGDYYTTIQGQMGLPPPVVVAAAPHHHHHHHPTTATTPYGNGYMGQAAHNNANAAHAHAHAQQQQQMNMMNSIAAGATMNMNMNMNAATTMGGLNTGGMGHSQQQLQQQQQQQIHDIPVPPMGPLDPSGMLIPEDKEILTDYFFYLMQQMTVCYFQESDRKAKGGSREHIQVGFAGLGCAHCAGSRDARKFFWSNVDRIANSFSEIPAHVLKCHHCPPEVKANLIGLKKKHPEQLARFPRGSQKVFLRRMWRRVHGSGEGSATHAVPSSQAGRRRRGCRKAGQQQSSPLMTQNEHTANMNTGAIVQQEQLVALNGHSGSVNHLHQHRVLLAISEDEDWLSDMDCFVRKNMEVFRATEKDVQDAHEERKYTISLGQVGIRCIHCAASAPGGGAKGAAVSYPGGINQISKAVREFRLKHLSNCAYIPHDLKAKMVGLKTSSSLTSVLKRYYVLSAKALGLVDSPNGIGIRTKDESLPIGANLSLDVLASIVSAQPDANPMNQAPFSALDPGAASVCTVNASVVPDAVASPVILHVGGKVEDDADEPQASISEQV